MREVSKQTAPNRVTTPSAKRRKLRTLETPQSPLTGMFRPTAAHRRILHAGLELLARSGWPTATAIALAVGRDRSTVAAHFRNPRFDAWFNKECDRFLASAQSKARAKFAALAMAGSVPHFVELGWSEAQTRRGAGASRWQRGRAAGRADADRHPIDDSTAAADAPGLTSCMMALGRYRPDSEHEPQAISSGWANVIVCP